MPAKVQIRHLMNSALRFFQQNKREDRAWTTLGFLLDQLTYVSIEASVPLSEIFDEALCTALCGVKGEHATQVSNFMEANIFWISLAWSGQNFNKQRHCGKAVA